MTVNASEYRRTFNILRLSGRMPSGVELARTMDRELKEARTKYPRLPDHQALALLRDDKRRTQKPLPVHDAFEDTGSQYRTARIEEKRDQSFEKVATPWELIWSRVVRYQDSRLTPVVDNSGSLVAYTGNIHYKDFLIDHAGHAGPGADTGMKNVEVLKHYRLFVGTNQFYGRTDLNVFGSSIITRHTVLTDIYGEVMSFDLGGRKDNSISSVSLLEIGGGVSLVRAALGLGISLGRTGLRTLIRRPPVPRKPLPENFSNDLRRAFAKTTTSTTNRLPAGQGFTDKYGNITYSTLGSADDVAFVKYHETVHSFLSPKLKFLRETRADWRLAAYNKSSLMRYLEEALAETYAQLKVRGFKGLPTGIYFPIKEGYVTLIRTVTEGAVAIIVVGGVTYGVHYVANK